MADLPSPVRDFVATNDRASRFVAYLAVTPDGLLVSWGGDLERCGIAGVTATALASRLAPFLVGLLPLGAAPFRVACAQIQPEFYADVHLFSAEEREWVVILDCTAEAKALQLRQQRANELALKRARDGGAPAGDRGTPSPPGRESSR